MQQNAIIIGWPEWTSIPETVPQRTPCEPHKFRIQTRTKKRSEKEKEEKKSALQIVSES